ncbi:1486_t:CDS:2, partial [Racocetra persica]
SPEDYKQKEIAFEYLTKASEEMIDELAKKDPMEIFEFLAPKHLEKNQGFGKVIGKEPKQFQTPCYLCNQKALTTI